MASKWRCFDELNIWPHTLQAYLNKLYANGVYKSIATQLRAPEPGSFVSTVNWRQRGSRVARIYLCPWPPLAGGGALECTDGDGVVVAPLVPPEVLRELREPAEPPPAIPNPAEPSVRITGAAWTRSVTVPRACTCWETFARLLISPRRTPNPAELFGIISLLPDRLANVDTGPRFTTTVARPPEGGCGATKLRGAFSTRGRAYQVVQTPPGCQAQP